MKDLKKTIKTYKLILVDGMNMVYRYHEKLPLSYKGKATGMFYGTVRFVFAMRNKHPGARIVFLWEGGDLIRKMKASYYKEDRRPKTTEFQRCLEELRDNLKYFGVESMVQAGLEADDLAGMLVENNNGNGNILLVTRDMDWMQFMKADGTVDFCRGDTIETYEMLQKALGYPPERVGLWKILKGDKIDNIRGIVRIHSSVVRYLCNECSDYKELKDVDLESINPAWKKWQDMIRQYWAKVIEKNAMLILYHPEWVNEKAIMLEAAEPDRKMALKILEENGCRSLIEDAENL